MLAFVQPVFAQENPLVGLTGYGALGIIAGCFILGLIVPKATVDKAEARAARAETREQQMLDDYKTVVEALHRATAAVEASDQAQLRRSELEAEMRVLLSQVRDALGKR